MRKLLGSRLYLKIKGAVGISGTFEPDENMYIIEEEMTCGEYNLVRAFLQYLHDNDKKMGSGNYEQRFTEYAEYSAAQQISTSPATETEKRDIIAYQKRMNLEHKG